MALHDRDDRFDYYHDKEPIGAIEIDGGGSIPFYENPKIRESKKAGYNRTQIFKRREPIRLWIGSTAKVLDVEIKFTQPHMESLGGIGTVHRAIAAARMSVEPRGSKGPPSCIMKIYGSSLTFPRCIVTDYELDMPYDQGAYGNESRVIVLRIKMEEYHGV